MTKRGNLLKTVLFLLVLCTSFPLTAQIKGTITDNQHKPIEFVNVALYALPDTTFITGAVTDSLGNYTITTDRVKNSLIKVTMVGFKTGLSVITDEVTPVVRHLTLETDERMLQELVVEGERPDYMGQKSSLDATRDTRFFSLSFLYRFGGYKEKERKEVDTSRFGM